MTTTAPAPPPIMDAGAFRASFGRMAANVEQVIRGKHDVVALALTCFFAQGHLLLEDVPGTGKTSLARALAVSFDAEWNRIQFTPDLLPTDVTGGMVYYQSESRYAFRPGPIFANIVLADEINRASAKTQSALLEAMEERQVTIEATTHVLEAPFMVVATQNPIDLDGTYQLPEAQLDRFLMRLKVDYPARDDELDIHVRQRAGSPIDEIGAVLRQPEAVAMMAAVDHVHMEPLLETYLVEVIRHTRTQAKVRLGVSPRGGLALSRAVRARALSLGRDYVETEDVKAMARPVLAHRILVTTEGEQEDLDGDKVVEQALSAVPAPQDRR